MRLRFWQRREWQPPVQPGALMMLMVSQPVSDGRTRIYYKVVGSGTQWTLIKDGKNTEVFPDPEALGMKSSDDSIPGEGYPEEEL